MEYEATVLLEFIFVFLKGMIRNINSESKNIVVLLPYEKTQVTLTLLHV